MDFQMPYYKGALPLHVPDENLRGVLTGNGGTYFAKAPQEEIVGEALRHPIGSAPLAELVKGKRKILLITSDHTRNMPSKITTPLLLREIRRGAPDADVTILIATGLHRATTRAEMLDRFGEDIVENEKIAVHDAFCKEDMRFICTLPSGAEFRVNRLAAEADLILSEGFIEPHFFAGFSGGRKSILPGISAAETVNENHSAKAIGHPLSTTGVLAGNVISEDMVYAARKIGLAFILNVAMDSEKRIIAAFAGDCEAAHEKGCRFVAGMCGVAPVKADIVITTNGGYPLDQNLYQSPKSVSTAAACANDGGILIIGASLCDGVGGTHFEAFMRMGDPQRIKDVIEAIPPKESVPEQWCAQIYAAIMLRHPIIVVSQHMPPKELEAMGFMAADSFDGALEKAFALKGADASVTVIPDGLSVIIKR